MVDEAVKISSHKPSSVVVYQRPQCKASIQTASSAKDYDWTELVSKVAREGKNKIQCEEMKSTDELYLLYTSGTTGKPKGFIFSHLSSQLGIVRESGGNAVQLAFTMQFIFNVKPTETIFCASDIGWVNPISKLC
jgi:propionyl-CoA synthetase